VQAYERLHVVVQGEEGDAHGSGILPQGSRTGTGNI
jgi:hypothetical protein